MLALLSSLPTPTGTVPARGGRSSRSCGSSSSPSSIVMFVRYRGHSHRGSYAGESRLAERYAAGEIDETEYRERMAVLRGSNTRGGGR